MLVYFSVGQSSSITTIFLVRSCTDHTKVSVQWGYCVSSSQILTRKLQLISLIFDTGSLHLKLLYMKLNQALFYWLSESEMNIYFCNIKHCLIAGENGSKSDPLLKFIIEHLSDKLSLYFSEDIEDKICHTYHRMLA
jgi:hypothetical protein